MITGIRIKNFKGIRDSGRVELGPFHVLIGANASGKSTFLDALDFIRSCVAGDTRKAVQERVPEFSDLTFDRKGGRIEFDIWMDRGDGFHYRLILKRDNDTGVCVEEEALDGLPGSTPLLFRDQTGNAIYNELGVRMTFRIGKEDTAMAWAPPDTDLFPGTNETRSSLQDEVRLIDLDSKKMRFPCSPLSPDFLERDGNNLARVVGALKRDDPVEFQRWLTNLSYALDDVRDIGWAKREVDNFEYITVQYESGFQCPSWLLSDGTLRTLALTILAHIPSPPGVLLVEEPENGVHPRALEIVVGALQAVTDGQVLVTTQSPLVVQEVGRDCLLAFTRDVDGIHVESGRNHPSLADWDGRPDLATIFSARVLG